ncbi:MAG: phosphoglucosamine mutase [Phycisphaerae bacterium]|nr:phosphoglucosamine mutase [Phycisphaerae bacterium]
MSEAPFMLGVSGARGIVGKTMTAAVASRFAACWGERLVATNDATPTVCLGRDSRSSGADLSAAAAEGLASTGCDVIDLGVVATPTVGVMIGVTGAAGGVVMTASHNPTPWNGLKLLDHHGTAPSPELAGSIISTFTSEKDVAAASEPGSISSEQRGTDTHVSKVLGWMDPMPLRDRGFKVVLDSVNGAGVDGGRTLLDAFGADVVHLGDQPDGNFWHTPEPTAENLKGLCEAVREQSADIGCAQDPDADRLALVDENGRYIGEEFTLVLAAWRVLLDHPGTDLVANLSTSRMIDDLAARFGSTVHRSAVGEANVAAVMRDCGAIVGGEGNGGIILPAITFVRDSLSGMALVLDLMRREGKTLSQLVDELPRYTIVKEKLELAQRSDLDPALASMRSAFADAKMDDCDGIRIDLPEGWAHVRPSNTEPIARIIVEASDEATARELVQRVRLATGL